MGGGAACIRGSSSSIWRFGSYVDPPLAGGQSDLAEDGFKRGRSLFSFGVLPVNQVAELPVKSLGFSRRNSVDPLFVPRTDHLGRAIAEFGCSSPKAKCFRKRKQSRKALRSARQPGPLPAYRRGICDFRGVLKGHRCQAV